MVPPTNSKFYIHLLVGHRGTGKTSLLNRLKQYYLAAGQAFVGVDLDSFIEESTERRIPDIFSLEGEDRFRKLEVDTLNLLIDQWTHPDSLLEPNTHIFVSLGAGFKGPIPTGTAVLFVERSTDAAGRIFMNRPRLDETLTPLDEYKARKSQRDIRFKKWKTKSLSLLEGFNAPYTAEKNYLLGPWQVSGAAITLLSEDFSQPNSAAQIKVRNDLLSSNLKYIELRDDLLTALQLEAALSVIPAPQTLISFRKDKPSPALLTAIDKKDITWDWPLELAPCPPKSFKGLTPTIYSLHEFKANENLAQALNRLTTQGAASFLKAAPTVKSFNELQLGHNWYLEDPTRRCFLPRSSDGKWSWYRLLMKDQFSVNFIREGNGSSADQPLILEWMNHHQKKRGFAAILGSPVDHSHTPAEHFDFFDRLGLPILRININIEDWESGAMNFLTELGLQYAAVTSPLKIKAFELVKVPSPSAKMFSSVNTLMLHSEDKIWHGHNTDYEGLEQLFKEICSLTDIAVWGGGGTLPLIQKILPKAHYFSARTGQLRSLDVTLPADYNPKVLIMASGRGKEIIPPPTKWTPKQVVDLNYTDHSPGLEYAQQQGCLYISGEIMFKTQAKKQREYFSNSF